MRYLRADLAGFPKDDAEDLRTALMTTHYRAAHLLARIVAAEGEKGDNADTRHRLAAIRDHCLAEANAPSHRGPAPDPTDAARRPSALKHIAAMGLTAAHMGEDYLMAVLRRIHLIATDALAAHPAPAPDPQVEVKP